MSSTGKPGLRDRRHEPARAGVMPVRLGCLVVVVAAHVTLIDRLLTKQKGSSSASRATRASSKPCASSSSRP